METDQGWKNLNTMNEIEYGNFNPNFDVKY